QVHPSFPTRRSSDLDPARLEAAAGYYWTSYEPGDAIRNVFKIFIPTQYDPSIAPPGCQILIVQKLTPVRLEQISDWQAHKSEVRSEEHTSELQSLAY